MQIERIQLEAIITVKILFKKRKQTAAIQINVQTIDCHVFVGMSSIKSKNIPSS